MKPRPLSVKGVSTSARLKNARLVLLPRRARLSYEDVTRAKRGFLTNQEIRAKVWKEVA